MKEKNDILFGFHSVYEALKAGKRNFYNILISKNRSSNRAGKIEDIARKRKIKIEIADPELLDTMTDFSNHQGLVARTSFFPIKKASEVITLVQKKKEPCFILVLENIEDPHNLGALIRTALCAGVDYILIPKNRSALPSSSVSRSSAGAMEHADIFYITNTVSILRSLKENGVWVSGLDALGDTFLFDSDLKGNIALVIGGEHKGIRPLVKKECDFLVSLPNKGNINSLNASVAGGVAMYEALRQRS
ncbi:MAG: 23S rRNA (guanosine(2251)-2'-O)-methyltransferase RlmB [Desulfobacula sp.]|jgi:23S rRNA (guanosine2251-2'-O)-methyltransferase|uniref:23S rRNA (guanosine(2251)-2'-O)-methyltransferase RlmB n=1 Tax=Desulfobacula sp. TaxID=2593537 RepID=UPI001DD8D6D4|nr:23S rRNA (guanosine(2251)-2'-O)-methyltransferase RlmB [Desulfobacula sp.]MBT3487538.1 23S rRNA (guanosine(2251)-2'-O)-methyltransferase RlmB [Desulfobacula sp.]MBT3806259.1 23S rRNA (guanosine(2251)-2'-O)-methyltransferase RlmB [Desulfobacula sp.]MBT4027020.1 23S rRNA (guanosine(2251)-2'-O)-methyltransferase RlmB [Desulfobacula sp.]MBT4199271.1 23S rRNA (guanosine(2251)-2'-O)-methyltransferase RlmB [Desulfobacula sp.]